MNITDITITSIETLTAFDVVTGAYLFTLDELQNVTIAQSEEKTDITGKQGRKLSTLKRNKAVTISGTNGMVSHGLLEKQTGGKFENKATEVLWTDYLTVQSNAATTSYKAVGTAGEGKFAYDPANKALTFSGLDNGTEVVVYYKRKITADVLDDMSDTYSGKATLYIDALCEDKCANVYRLQIYVPKADFSGEFSFEMGDNQTVHEFEADALAGACGAGGQFFSYTVFGANTADVA